MMKISVGVCVHHGLLVPDCVVEAANEDILSLMESR